MEIRPLARHAEFRAAVELQREIWGFSDSELLPLRLFITAPRIGGQAFGAWDGKRLAGFCISIPGLKPRGKQYLHSLMLGIRPEFRNRGIGGALKWRQREEALSRGIDLMEWTFDPLEIKNAWFNLERLGAIVRRYVYNLYGITSSPLHGGLPTSRCIAEWWLSSPRVSGLLTGQGCPPPEIHQRICVPADIGGLRASDPDRAREIQTRIGGEMEAAFAQSWAAVGFERSETAGTYLIGSWQSN